MTVPSPKNPILIKTTVPGIRKNGENYCIIQVCEGQLHLHSGNRNDACNEHTENRNLLNHRLLLQGPE